RMSLKTKIMRLKYLLFAIVAILTVSCKDKDPREEAQEQVSNLFKYREYVSDVSQGVVSTMSDIRVVLTQAVSGWEKDKELPERLFRVSPAVKGKVIALSNQALAFVPEKPLEQDVEYEFTLDLEMLIDDLPSDLRKFRFRVKTIKQEFNIITE